MDNYTLHLKELQLLAKAEELEQQAERLMVKAKQYRVEAGMLLCNLPRNEKGEVKAYENIL